MDAVMVRFGELFLKSEPVRRRFLDRLVRNIAAALDAGGMDFTIERFRSRILVRGEETDAIADAMRRVFGVVDASECLLVSNTRDDIADAAVRLAGRALEEGMTYAVRARREGVSGYNSQELAAHVGAAIGEQFPGVSVDLSRPDYEVMVEAREFGGIVYDHRLQGPGGLPYGTQGRALALISEGIDSPVASWMVMRRGVELAYLYCDGGDFVGSGKMPAVLSHLRTLSTWSAGYPLDLHIADITPFYRSLVAETKERYRCILCKRFMVRLAGLAAMRTGAEAVVTGENLGQVASQTLTNLSVIWKVSPVPLLHPLIAFDKEETVQTARRIGTFLDSPGDLSCKVVPKSPSVAAEIGAVLEEEEKIDIDSLLYGALDTIRCIRAEMGDLSEIS